MRDSLIYTVTTYHQVDYLYRILNQHAKVPFVHVDLAFISIHVYLLSSNVYTVVLDCKHGTVHVRKLWIGT